MSDFALLRAADRRALPWKNGGGTTAEVCAYPPGSGFEDFQWRISIADVAAAGPFSSFAGIDRVLTILDGELELRLHGVDSAVVLTTRSEPFRFAGDVPCHGAPHTASVRDLNVMTRRGQWSARVERLRSLPGCGGLRHEAGPAMLVAGTSFAVQADSEHLSLAALDAVLLQPGVMLVPDMNAIHDWAIYIRLDAGPGTSEQ